MYRYRCRLSASQNCVIVTNPELSLFIQIVEPLVLTFVCGYSYLISVVSAYVLLMDPFVF